MEPERIQEAKMGTVHGVYLKYVGISALSYAGYSMLSRPTGSGRNLGELGKPSVREISSLVLGYSAVVNGVIAALFKSEWGMSIIGKNRKTGKIPLWSYVAFFPFHIPTYLYTHLHTKLFVKKVKDEKTGTYSPVPVCTEVQPGWWIGGRYGHELNKDWGGVIDLTVEFPESCWNRTMNYLSAPTWDGVPLGPDDLEAAANFAVEARNDGDVLVHCAHGRGRSTTVMCACLVKAGLFPNWEEAFEKGIKPYRSVCKLNRRMRQNLATWHEEYVIGKKIQLGSWQGHYVVGKKVT